MARKKEVKEATISETKDTKKAENVEEVEVVEEEKKDTKAKKEMKEKKGLLAGIRKEMKQVVWPSAGDILKSTIAVIVICLFLSLFFMGITLFMAWLKSFVGGLKI